MGSSSSEEARAQSLENNEWLRYEAELEGDKASDVPPFLRRELAFLEELFNMLDKKNLKSVEVKDFEEVSFLREHPLFPRIRELFEDELRKIKAKRINFELFLFLLSVFHVATPVEAKVRFLFRLYDCDKNLRIDAADLAKVYRLTYQMPFLQDEDYSKLVTETLIKYGTKGEIRLENLLEILPADEVKETMSFRFNSKFA